MTEGYLPIHTNGTPGTVVVTDPKYGAYGDGVHDDTAAIQAAIDAVSDGGTMYLPPGTYVTSDTLTISNPGVTIRGSGTPFPNSPFTGLAVIAPQSGDYDILKAAGTAHHVAIENLVINPSAAMTGGYAINLAGASSSDYLQQPAVRNIYAQNVWGGVSTVNVQAGEYRNLIFQGVYGPYGWYATNWTLPYLNFVVVSASATNTVAYYWSGNVGSIVAFNVTQDNAAATANQGFYLNGLADSDFYSCAVNGTKNSQIQMVGCADVRWHSVYAYYGQSHGIEIDNSSGIFLLGGEIEANAGSAVLLDGTTGQTSGVRISSLILAASGTGSTADSGVTLQNNVSQSGVSNCTIVGNGVWPHGINDLTTAGPAYNAYSGNTIWNTTSTGINASGSAKITATGNAGYNPVGPLTAPSIPASGTAQTNDFPVNVRVFVSGGTVSAIAINGTDTGLTSGQITLGPGETITLTYSAAPSWAWLGL